jgi:hypothetical protein
LNKPRHQKPNKNKLSLLKKPSKNKRSQLKKRMMRKKQLNLHHLKKIKNKDKKVNNHNNSHKIITKLMQNFFLKLISELVI